MSACLAITLNMHLDHDIVLVLVGLMRGIGLGNLDAGHGLGLELLDLGSSLPDDEGTDNRRDGYRSGHLFNRALTVSRGGFVAGSHILIARAGNNIP